MAAHKSKVNSKTCRLSFMLVLTFLFFLVELIVGHVTHSLALVSDSYHMLSDVLAQVIGLASLRISKLKTEKNTYGWARAEVVGAMFNAVFLVALNFTIFLEAIERLTSVEPVENEKLMLYVGIIGLVINVIGLIMLHGHAHGHSHGGGGGHGHSHGGGHGHSHEGGHGHSHGHGHGKKGAKAIAASPADDSAKEVQPLNPVEGDVEACKEESKVVEKKPKLQSSAQLNMRGVFLHLMGDALGSVAVVINALLIMFIDADWKYMFDPIVSLVLVTIVVGTTAPLLKESAMILLQTVPTHIQIDSLKETLVKKVSGVLAVHELHVWQLAGNRIIASAHIRCQNLQDYTRIAGEVKAFFHNEGIHSTTIQPEFAEFEDLESGTDCMLECGPEKSCHADTCCTRSKPTEQGSPGKETSVGDAAAAAAVAGDSCVVDMETAEDRV